MRNLLFALSFILILFSSCKKDEAVKNEAITEIPKVTIPAFLADWEMRQADTDNWLPVSSIPSTVHTALLENGVIQDPFYRNNEADLQWIETKDWEYRKRFNVAPELLNEEVVELNFKGLDTYADIYLNGQKVLEADNMFRSWLVDAKALLKAENNELRIHFFTPINKENEKWAALGYELPDGSRRAVTRKAAFHYGWDWGPRYVTMGIWKPIEIRAWSKASINEVHYRTFPDGDKANIQAFFDVDATVAGQAKISVNIAGKTFDKSISLQAGNNKDSLSFTLENVKLWWPNGMGEQALYDVTGKVASADFSDSKTDRIGIRNIELKQPKNRDQIGFFFEVNGIPVFAKGANYIPQDIFQDRVTDAQYAKLLGDAKKANMNMLRVWGGGIYENDIFYKTCDELGLLVWQDFMFANAMVPGDEAFRQNVSEEAKEQVNRLSNHPCIALWCGNNEISEGWHRWGWQDGLNKNQTDKIWSDYQHIFNNILPNSVATIAPHQAYWESSPQLGRGDANHVNVGDAHYWGIWHDAEPFENFNKKVPRFMSEFGFQSLPDIKTIESFTKVEDRNLDSEAMKAHQKHSRGTKLIKEYMARDYRTPKDFDNFIYVSQLVQADGVLMGIKAHLSGQPDCMGSLYWQLNDCWPAVSWSSIDHSGQWKALHYAAQDVFHPMTVFYTEVSGTITVFLINSTNDTLHTNGGVAITDFDGNILDKREGKSKILPKEVRIITGGSTARLIGNYDPRTTFISINIRDSVSNYLCSDNLFFVKPKELKLPKVNITTTVSPTEGGYLLHLESDKVAKSVYLQINEEGFFTDNFFDLIPGKAKEVVFETKETLGDFENKFKARSLVDSYE